MKLNFLVRRTKAVNGLVPLYVRIVGLGRPAELSLNKYISPKIWDNKGGRLCGRGEEVLEIADFIESVRYDLGQAFRELYREENDFNAQMLKNRYLGISSKQPVELLEMFKYHYKLSSEDHQKRSRVRIRKLTPGTLKNYRTTIKYVKKYIRSSYRMSDILLIELNYAFIQGFEDWLFNMPTPPGQHPINNNGVMKHIERLKAVVNMAIRFDFLQKDPFMMYQKHMEETDVAYLALDEIEKIKQAPVRHEGYQLVKDLFIFACYTGLAYADMQKLTPGDIVMGIDNMNWIMDKRKKSKVTYRLPLLPEAEEIVVKYKDDPRAVKSGTCFPKFSNQKINAYLKEIARSAQINKKLTYHMGRHTFGTTITLTNGVPLESIQKMMGHRKLSSTQVYAKVVNLKLSEDIKVLKNKLYNNQPNLRKVE